MSEASASHLTLPRETSREITSGSGWVTWAVIVGVLSVSPKASLGVGVVAARVWWRAAIVSVLGLTAWAKPPKDHTIKAAVRSYLLATTLFIVVLFAWR